MSKKLSRSDALEDISTWSTNDVLCLLRKNGLEECCGAVAKRQIDGDELLHLTEGKLALWKSDLNRPLMWALWTFVEEIKKCPEKYVLERTTAIQQGDDHMSDTGSWDTDFEDDVPEENCYQVNTKKHVDVARDDSSYTLGRNEAYEKNVGKSMNTAMKLDREIRKEVAMAVGEAEDEEEEEEEDDEDDEEEDEDEEEEEEDSTYANCDTCIDQDNVYANFKMPAKNPSRLHASSEKTLAEQLKEQLQLRNAKKPTIGPKPDTVVLKKIENISSISRQPQKSFLHDAAKSTQKCAMSNAQKRMSVPPPPPPKRGVEENCVGERTDKDATRQSISIRNLDLLANLPTRTDESDEYEQFDERIIEQNQKALISRIDSKQSLISGPRSSAESVYQPPSVTSCEEEEEPYEIYESITETPDDDGYYLSPIRKTFSNNSLPPPLPSKPSQTPSPTPSQTKLDISNDTKRNVSLNTAVRRQASLSECLTQATLTQARLNLAKRSPDKKSATLPHPGSTTSLSSERATRPLPPPPDRQSYVDKPWFHNVTREQATALIKEQGTYGNPQDGYFLLRPSTTNINNPLALVLWCKDRVYNVAVRKRPDNRYALGSAKVNEESFSSVEEIVTFYSKEDLVLYTGGVQTGSTKLTDTPPK